MSSAMLFAFNAVELYVVTINQKSWTHARKLCKALEYDTKTSKTANIIRAHCSPEIITQKYQLSSVLAVVTPVNWDDDPLVCSMKQQIITEIQPKKVPKTPEFV